MRDKIIALAREAGLGTALCHNSIDGDRIWIEGADWHDEVERFYQLAVAEDREKAERKLAVAREALHTIKYCQHEVVALVAREALAQIGVEDADHK